MAVSQSYTLTQLSQDVAGNSSQVRILWTSTQSGQSRNDFEKEATYTVSFNGVQNEVYTVKYTLPQYTTQTIVDTVITVPHLDNGDGSITVRFYMETGISAGTINTTRELILTPIARESSCGAIDANIESKSITKKVFIGIGHGGSDPGAVAKLSIC